MTTGKVAFCFPGQGSQLVGMGAEMAAAYPAARAVFDTASEELGYDLAEACFEGPLERLSQTDVTQPALIATSLACLAAVHEEGFAGDFVVGHSVGEYAALGAAGSIDTREAIYLVRERGLAMAEAAAEAPGAMAAIIGLQDAQVEELCAGIEGVWPANYNCPGQVVVSGTVEGVDALVAAAPDAGARRALKLNISGGFHSPLTAPAERRLRPALESVTFREPRVPFLSTVTCRLEGAADVPRILVDQLTAPVRFTQAVGALVALGATTFVEIGSGNVLAGLVKRIDRGVRALAVGGPADLAKLREALADG